VDSPETLLHTPAAREPSAPRRGPARILGEQPGGGRDGGRELLLDRYRLIERLGAGGFGEVWRAHDELLHREVAVKRVRLGPDGDSERAAREALAAARLSHPAIVALYEACAVDDAFYLISELVHSETLARLIAEDALSDEEIIEIGLALAAALLHAHARGVIHRDIKPHNVLVPHSVEDAAGAAKLTDFGGASLIGEDALTRTGDVLGTLAYMAPEQSEGREVSEQADLYALALVLYEALSGVNPVRGTTPAATARRIGTRLPPLERTRRELPRNLTRALDTALAPSPRERGSLERLRAALQDALEREPWEQGRPERRRALAPRAPGASPPDLAPAPAPRRAAEGPPRQAPAPTAPEPELPEQDTPPRARALALPRAMWLACAIVAVGWQVWAGRPGVALLAAAALAPLLALPRRAGPAWAACALAPALGVIGLAGAFPAIAGQARRWQARAAMAALGFWWLVLAEPLLARRLWLGPPHGTPPRSVWEGSLDTAAVHVIAPALTVGVLLGALLWALGAAVLPWIVRGRSAALDVVAATTWSAALVAAAQRLDAPINAAGGHPDPRGAILGGVLGGVIAVAARALRGPV